MSEFERVLSKEDAALAAERVGFFHGSEDEFQALAEALEQAVLAKLHEQEQPDVTQLLKALERIANMDSMSYHSLDSAKITARNALAAHPMPCVSPTSDKTACVSEIAESDIQRHLDYIKRYQKWRRGEDKTMTEMGLTPKQIGEALDWLIGVAENHIADASKMVCSDHIPDSGQMIPDGWQLVPKEPTTAMREAFNDADDLWEDGVGVKPDAQYKAMLAAAPKSTP